ncbi:MAG TPA: Arm DNA-binding domain-containing protein, partial [Alphaproteobacteria bacterium]
MKRKIIKRSIDALRKGEIVWDTALSGFGARRHASGAVTFLIKYRAGRRQRWLKLGTFGRMTPAEARTAARIALGAVEKG